jgi:energy-coupling factor transporter ATP-binding protein EcfA2
MSAPLDNALAELGEWFSKQPIWLQYAARDVLEGKQIGSGELVAFAKQAISEAKGELALPSSPLQLGTLGAQMGGSVALRSLSKITGVGQLNPKNPLSFGDEKLSVVFGPNGSGKSSFVRILKHACGARHKGDIHENVFDSTSFPLACSLAFRDETGEASVEWEATTGVVPALSTIDIFDTLCGQSYLTSEAQPSYEPRLVAFVSSLAGLCDSVAAKIMGAISKRVKALPVLPVEHAATMVGRWYSSLSCKVIQSDVETNCSWTEVDENEIAELGKYLAELSPKDRAKELQTKKTHLDAIVASLREHCAAFSDEAFLAISNLRAAAKEKQETAELAAKVNLQDAALEGVGTKQWLNLWSIARSYSGEIAYPEATFPNVEEDARCVLCQQTLSPDAKIRLLSFEAFVTNQAALDAKTAKEALDKAVSILTILPQDEALEAKSAACGLGEDTVGELKAFYKLLRKRRSLFEAGSAETILDAAPIVAEWISSAETLSVDLASKAKQFLEGFNEAELATKTSRLKELSARKWIAGQKVAVEAEVKRLGEVAVLERGKDFCGTKAISFKAGKLASDLITPAYIAAFNAELRRLGAKRISVELVKTGVSRGAILHQVRLRDFVRNTPIHEVLSEGEHRIVSIAAFLADVGSKPNGSTFVFDDPISSLDLDYEEAVVQRLVDLARNRQVIIFTHRLSLVGMVEDYAEKEKIELRMIHIRKEPWGAGEPGNPTIEAARPKTALNDLLPKRIAAARAVLEKEGDALYRVYAQSICTETRKLVERMIEWDLLADVIQRHRRGIKTMNKIEKLADILPEDCKFLDEMMTKYSRYEHAQSAEAPVALPEPDELEEDVARLKKWRDELEKRRK